MYVGDVCVVLIQSCHSVTPFGVVGSTCLSSLFILEVALAQVALTPSLLIKRGCAVVTSAVKWSIVARASFSDSWFCSYLSVECAFPGHCMLGCLFLVLTLVVTSPSLSSRPNFQICNHFLLQMVMLWLSMRNLSGCLESATVTSSCTWGQQGNGKCPSYLLN